ncbi:MAG: DNA-damage-inducible protein J [Rubritalea sp.]|jgi:DNA-damage-inducible protein J
MATTTKSSVQVRLDETLKRDAESVFENLGVDTPTAIRIFFKKVVATRSIPFNLEENPYTFTKEEEQEILNACDPNHEDSEVVAVTKTPQETRKFLDSLKK